MKMSLFQTKVVSYLLLVSVNIKSRQVHVKGPLGEITKTFRHVPVDIVKAKNAQSKDVVRVQMWFGKYK